MNTAIFVENFPINVEEVKKKLHKDKLHDLIQGLQYLIRLQYSGTHLPIDFLAKEFKLKFKKRLH